MKQTLLFFAFALALCLEAQAQVNNIVLNAGVAYTNGAPTFRPGGKGSRIAIDTVTWIWYESLDNNTGNWIESGYRVQPISGCSHPAYTPNKHQSVLVINGCDSLYYYRAGAWRHINPPGVSGVAWGDITGDITNQTDLQTALSDKADAAHNHPLSDVLQSGATSGQVPKWNGSAWVPATDDNTGTTYTAGTGIAISGGNVISNTGDLSNTNEIQTVSFNSATGNLSISGGNSASLDGRYLQSEVDGSVTNEIELPSQTGNSGKYLTTNGTAPSWATVSGGSATDLSISGTSSPLTLNSSTGTDVTITAGTGISLAGSASNVTINNTGITGSGTAGKVARFSGSTVIGAASIYDDGTSAAIGTSSLTTLSLRLRSLGSTNSYYPLFIEGSNGASMSTWRNDGTINFTGGLTLGLPSFTSPPIHFDNEQYLSYDLRTSRAYFGRSPVFYSGQYMAINGNYSGASAEFADLKNILWGLNGSRWTRMSFGSNVAGGQWGYTYDLNLNTLSNPASGGLSYPDGYMYFSFWWGGSPDTISVRYQVVSGAWSNYYRTTINSNPGFFGNTVGFWKIKLPTISYLKKIEVTFRNRPAATTNLQTVEYLVNEIGDMVAGRAFFDKTRPKEQLSYAVDFLGTSGSVTGSFGANTAWWTNNKIGAGVSAPASQVDVQGATGYSQLRLRTTYTPTSTADANGNTGDFSWDDNYIYIKTSAGWKRAALSTF